MNLTHDEALSNFEFTFNLRPYPAMDPPLLADDGLPYYAGRGFRSSK